MRSNRVGPTFAQVAQLGERQTEDLNVPGSSPGLGIYFKGSISILKRVLTIKNLIIIVFIWLVKPMLSAEKAIEVCEKATAFGLHDGTKGDYQARIERIKKKMQ